MTQIEMEYKGRMWKYEVNMKNGLYLVELKEPPAMFTAVSQLELAVKLQKIQDKHLDGK